MNRPGHSYKAAKYFKLALKRNIGPINERKLLKELISILEASPKFFLPTNLKTFQLPDAKGFSDYADLIKLPYPKMVVEYEYEFESERAILISVVDEYDGGFSVSSIQGVGNKFSYIPVKARFDYQSASEIKSNQNSETLQYCLESFEPLSKEKEKDLRGILSGFLGAVIFTCILLGCKNVKETRIPNELLRHANRTANEGGKILGNETRTLDIFINKKQNSWKKISVRKLRIGTKEHDVLAHDRYYKNGKKTRVRNHKRGNPELGIIEKSYNLILDSEESIDKVLANSGGQRSDAPQSIDKDGGIWSEK